MPSPTEIALKEFRARGWQCKVVERWNAFARIRQDVWGGDILACHPDAGVALIQVSTIAHIPERERKCREIPEVHVWLAAGGQFFLAGVQKKKPRGYRIEVTEIRTQEIGKPETRITVERIPSISSKQD